MNVFDHDAISACHGLDAVTVKAQVGSLTGLWDQYDQDLPYDRELPRFVSDIGAFVVFEVATVELRKAFGLSPSEKVNTIRQRSLTNADVSYTVREAMRLDDGRTTQLFLVLT